MLSNFSSMDSILSMIPRISVSRSVIFCSRLILWSILVSGAGFISF